MKGHFIIGYVLFVILFVGALGLSNQAKAGSLITPVLTSPKEDAKINKAFILLEGAADPNMNLYIKINDRERERVKGDTTDGEGLFSFYHVVKNRRANKTLNVKVYTRDPDTKEYSSAGDVRVVIKASHRPITFTGAAVLDECNNYDEVAGATIEGYITTDDAVPLVKIATTTTKGDESYTIDLPNNTNVRIYASKTGYRPRTPHSITFNTATDYTNGYIGNQMYLCGK